MKNLLLRGMAGALVVSLASAGAANAAWEPAKRVDNPGSATQTVGATGNYTGLADGSGISTAYFEQSVGGTAGYYSIRRGSSDTAWGTPQPVTEPATSNVASNQPITAGADPSGNAVGLSVQTPGGSSNLTVFQSTWPVSSASPSPFASLMSGTDPAIAFDSTGNGYAVAGPAQGSNDGPILIAVYKSGTWSAATQIINPGQGGVNGEEPRLAVSPDGTVVVVFLQTTNGAFPGVTNKQLFAVAAPKGAVAAAANPGGAFTTAPQKISSNPVSVNGPPNFDVATDTSDVATIVDAESQSGLNAQVFATQWALGNATIGAPGGSTPLSSSSPPEPPASEPRVTVGPSSDATAVWTEMSQSSPPPANALLSSELIAGKWSSPQTITDSVDNPSNPQGYPVNTPPFWMSENSNGNVFLVWTNSGKLQDSIRQPAKNWSSVDTIPGVSSATPGTERVVASSQGTSGQADATVVNGGALYASRFSGQVPPARNTPPTASTGQATSVTQTSATLNGTVNPEGQDTHWSFQYGTTTNYGSTTPSQDAGSGISDTAVSAQVSGLTPATTYHFRLVATNASGTTNGPDQTFTTQSPPGPPGATTSPATSITQNAATLNGTENPDGAATSYHFQYGTSTSYGQTTPSQDAGSGTTTQSVSAAISGLSPATTYHFRLVATNTSGTTNGQDQTFTTSSPPPPPPPSYTPCNVRPRVSISSGQVSANRIVVRGSARERKCGNASPADRRANHLVNVYVTIYQPAPLGKCRFLKKDGTLTPTIPCSQPVQYLATGTSNWSLQLRVHVPHVAGGYLIRVSAIDGFGRRSPREPAATLHVKSPKAKSKRRR